MTNITSSTPYFSNPIATAVEGGIYTPTKTYTNLQWTAGVGLPTLNALINAAGGDEKALNDWLTTTFLSTDLTKPNSGAPKNWDDFLKAFNTKFGTTALTLANMGLAYQDEMSAALSDSGVTTNYQDQFKSAFNTFISNYISDAKYDKIDLATNTSLGNFVHQWGLLISDTVNVSSSASTSTPAPSLIYGTGTDNATVAHDGVGKKLYDDIFALNIGGAGWGTPEYWLSHYTQESGHDNFPIPSNNNILIIQTESLLWLDYQRNNNFPNPSISNPKTQEFKDIIADFKLKFIPKIDATTNTYRMDFIKQWEMFINPSLEPVTSVTGGFYPSFSDGIGSIIANVFLGSFQNDVSQIGQFLKSYFSKPSTSRGDITAFQTAFNAAVGYGTANPSVSAALGLDYRPIANKSGSIGVGVAFTNFMQSYTLPTSQNNNDVFTDFITKLAKNFNDLEVGTSSEPAATVNFSGISSTSLNLTFSDPNSLSAQLHSAMINTLTNPPAGYLPAIDVQSSAIADTALNHWMINALQGTHDSIGGLFDFLASFVEHFYSVDQSTALQSFPIFKTVGIIPNPITPLFTTDQINNVIYNYIASYSLNLSTTPSGSIVADFFNRLQITLSPSPPPSASLAPGPYSAIDLAWTNPNGLNTLTFQAFIDAVSKATVTNYQPPPSHPPFPFYAPVGSSSTYAQNAANFDYFMYTQLSSAKPATLQALLKNFAKAYYNMSDSDFDEWQSGNYTVNGHPTSSQIALTSLDLSLYNAALENSAAIQNRSDYNLAFNSYINSFITNQFAGSSTAQTFVNGWQTWKADTSIQGLSTSLPLYIYNEYNLDGGLGTDTYNALDAASPNSYPDSLMQYLATARSNGIGVTASNFFDLINQQAITGITQNIPTNWLQSVTDLRDAMIRDYATASNQSPASSTLINNFNQSLTQFLTTSGVYNPLPYDFNLNSGAPANSTSIKFVQSWINYVKNNPLPITGGFVTQNTFIGANISSTGIGSGTYQALLQKYGGPISTEYSFADIWNGARTADAFIGPVVAGGTTTLAQAYNNLALQTAMLTEYNSAVGWPGTTPPSLNDLTTFKDSLSTFLFTYSIPTTSTTTSYTSDFIAKWATFLTTTAKAPTTSASPISISQSNLTLKLTDGLGADTYKVLYDFANAPNTTWYGHIDGPLNPSMNALSAMNYLFYNMYFWYPSPQGGGSPTPQTLDDLIAALLGGFKGGTDSNGNPLTAATLKTSLLKEYKKAVNYQGADDGAAMNAFNLSFNQFLSQYTLATDSTTGSFLANFIESYGAFLGKLPKQQAADANGTAYSATLSWGDGVGKASYQGLRDQEQGITVQKSGTTYVGPGALSAWIYNTFTSTPTGSRPATLTDFLAKYKATFTLANPTEVQNGLLEDYKAAIGYSGFDDLTPQFTQTFNAFLSAYNSNPLYSPASPNTTDIVTFISSWSKYLYDHVPPSVTQVTGTGNDGTPRYILNWTGGLGQEMHDAMLQLTNLTINLGTTGSPNYPPNKEGALDYWISKMFTFPNPPTTIAQFLSFFSTQFGPLNVNALETTMLDEYLKGNNIPISAASETANKGIFETAFTNYLQNYRPVQSNGTTEISFFTGWGNYITSIAQGFPLAISPQPPVTQVVTGTGFNIYNLTWAAGLGQSMHDAMLQLTNTTSVYSQLNMPNHTNSPIYPNNQEGALDYWINNTFTTKIGPSSPFTSQPTEVTISPPATITDFFSNFNRTFFISDTTNYQTIPTLGSAPSGLYKTMLDEYLQGNNIPVTAANESNVNFQTNFNNAFNNYLKSYTPLTINSTTEISFFQGWGNYITNNYTTPNDLGMSTWNALTSQVNPNIPRILNGTVQLPLPANPAASFNDWFLNAAIPSSSIKSLKAFLDAFTGKSANPGNTANVSPNADVQKIMAGLSDDYRKAFNIPANVDVTAAVTSAFNTFMANYRATGPLTGSADFISAWGQFLNTQAVTNFSNYVNNPYIESYERIYKAFFPNGDFKARFKTFYTDQVAKNGYFIPGQLTKGTSGTTYLAWASTMMKEYIQTSGVRDPSGVIDTTTLASVGFDKVNILNRIFILLASLMGTMQKVAAAQADRLRILTQWQAAYTNEVNQVPVFLQDNNEPFIGAAGHEGLRASLNTYNTTLRDSVTSFRTAISDDAKSLQSYVNQSNDAATQQADMATSFLQELTTLLSSIYR